MKTNNVTTGQLFQNFVNYVYPAPNQIAKIASEYSGGTDHQSDPNWFKTIGDANEGSEYYEAWLLSPLGMEKDKDDNPIYPYQNSCYAMNDSVNRGYNIYQNPAANVNLYGVNSHNRYTSVLDLMYDNDINSSFDVTKYTTEGFVDACYTRFLPYDTSFTEEQKKQVASAYYNSASNIYSRVMIQYMGVQDAANDGRQVPWNNFGSNYANLPTYQELFNQRSYLTVDENLSVLSPSAYLTDLSKCASEYVKAEDEQVDVSARKISNRRPDIAKLKLTATNTTTEIPKLQIVNKALLAQCEAINTDSMSVDIKSDMEGLNSNAYPLNAPYNFYLEKLRPALKLLETSLADIWGKIQPSGVVNQEDNYMLAIALEELRVSQNMHDSLLSQPLIQSDDLNDVRARFGLMSVSANSQITIREFLETTFISPEELADIVYGDLSDKEINTEDAELQPRLRFFINGWYNSRQITENWSPLGIGYGDNGDQEWTNYTSVGRMDRANRLVRLSQRSEMSIIDLNWINAVFTSATPQQDENEETFTFSSFYKFIATIKQIASDYSITDMNVATAAVGLVKDFGSRSGETMMQSIFGNVASSYHFDFNSYEESWTIPNLSDSIYNLSEDPITVALMRGTQLSLPDLVSLGNYMDDLFGYAVGDPILLTQDYLSALYRVSLATRLLETDLTTMLFLLDELEVAGESASAFAGPFIHVPNSSGNNNNESGALIFAQIFESLQTFVQNWKETDFAEDDLLLMGNAANQPQHQLPGLNESLEVVQQMVSEVTEDTLLSETAYNDWLSQFDPDGSNSDYDQATYTNLAGSDYIDTVDTEDESILPVGVVLITSYTSEGSFQLPVEAQDSFNELLQEYYSQQIEVINAVLANVLDISSGKGANQNISDWKKVITPQDEATTDQAYNLMHVFYSEPVALMEYSGKDFSDLDSTDMKNQIDMLIVTNRLAILINTLDLDQSEVLFLLGRNTPQLLFRPTTSQEPFTISPTVVGLVADFHNLYAQYSERDNHLISYLSEGVLEGSAEDLAKATGWDEAQISAIQSDWTEEGQLLISGLTSTEVVQAMEDLFQLADLSTTLTPSALLSLKAHAGDNTFDGYEGLSVEFTDIVYEANESVDAITLSNTLTENLDQSYRDVLAGTLLQILRVYTNEEHDKVETQAYYNNISTYTDLSQFLLTDIEVTGKFNTSEVREAISAYTTYIHRIEMNVEPGLLLDNEFRKNEYIWKGDYRVWEANRKVFLNPENYLQPDLRKGQSDAFGTFVSEVNQAILNDDNVTIAFDNYLQGFQTVGNLETVGSSMQYENGVNIILFVGRTLNQPYEYYTRKLFLNKDSDTGNLLPSKWTPWANPSAEVSSRFIEMIPAFNTLFLFWIEFESAQHKVDDVLSSEPAYNANIKYIFLQVNDQWSPVQDLGDAKDLIEDVDYNVLVLDTDAKYHDIRLQLGVDPKNAGGLIEAKYYDSNGKLTADFTLDKYFDVTDLLNDITPALNSEPLQIVFDGTQKTSTELKYVVEQDGGNYYPNLSLDISEFIETIPSDGIPIESQPVYNFDGTQENNGNRLGLGLNTQEEEGFDSSVLTTGFWYYAKNGLPTSGNQFVGTFDSQSSENFTIRVIEGRVIVKYNNIDVVWINNSQITSSTWLFICFSTRPKSQNRTTNCCLYVGRLDPVNKTVQTIGTRSIGAGDWEALTRNKFAFVNSDANAYLQQMKAVNGFFGISLMESNMKLLSGLPLTAKLDVHEYFDNLPEDATGQWVTGSAQSAFTMNTGTSQYLGLGYIDSGNQLWRFIRMSSQVASMNLLDVMRTGGVSGLLSIDTQLTSEDSFSSYEPLDLVPEIYWPDDNNIDIQGANANYYWELFCFSPWMVANVYENAGDYSNSNKWLRYVFDPTIRYADISGQEQSVLDLDQNENDIYWRFIGLRTYYNTPLAFGVYASPQGKLLTEQSDNELSYGAGDTGSAFTNSMRNQALAEYNDDPFAPHPLAYLRPTAYQKAIVMSMIKGKLDWADRLYTMATRDTLMQSVILYLEANDLLGNKSQNAGEFGANNQITTENENTPPERTLEGINALYSDDGNSVPEFLIGLESNLDLINGIPTRGNATLSPFNFIPGLYFGIPENAQILTFWNTVQQRLTNIRNSLDINGNPLNLNMFEPSINPMDLVNAVARGLNLSDAIQSVVGTNAPIYRYSVLLLKAKEFTGMVSSFGQSLLAAIEKKDGQKLAELELNQQASILTMSLEMKQLQISQTEKQLEAIQENLKLLMLKSLYYNQLINSYNSSEGGSSLVGDSSGIALLKEPNDTSAEETLTLDDGRELKVDMDFADAFGASLLEESGLNQLKTSKDFQLAASLIGVGATVAYLIPTIFGTSNGGSNPGGVISALAGNMQTFSTLSSMQSQISNTNASYKRRREEWSLQLKNAQIEIEQLKKQYEATSYQLDSTRKDYEITQTQITQNREILDFYKNKFSNEALYQWMEGYLTGTYFQAYRLALDMSLEAQSALCYDLGIARNGVDLINKSSWNSRFEGLLAGEMLSHSLNLLDRYYMENNFRRQEVVKTIPLSEIDDANNTETKAIVTLKNDGVVSFDITPNYLLGIDENASANSSPYSTYKRLQIKMVSVTVPMLLGPYEDFVGILRQDGNSVEPNGDDSRVNWGSPQQITISSAQEDVGLFSPNMDDPRYLPFECTGADSSWTMRIDSKYTGEDSPISDVIVKIRYIAEV